MSLDENDSSSTPASAWPTIKMVLGPLTAALVWIALEASSAMHPAAIAVAALALWMAIWWMTEAIPLAATALLPIVILPLIDFSSVPPRTGDWLMVQQVAVDGTETWAKARVVPSSDSLPRSQIRVALATEQGVSEQSQIVELDATRPWGNVPKPLERVLVPYADSFIFLFLGGFIVARGIERWNLHRRVSIYVMSTVGSSPAMLIAGAMAVTAAMSMWLSNTATTLVMLPVAMSLVDPLRGQGPEGSTCSFRGAMALCIAYSATMGGLMTPIGTPPNALLIKELESHDYSVSFGQWMLFAVPLSLAMLGVTWFILTRVVYRVPTARNLVAEQELRKAREALGRMTTGEKLAGAVFTLVAVSWIFRTPLQSAFDNLLPAVSNWLGDWQDATVAIAGALLMFAVPVSLRPWKPLLTWEQAKDIPWDVLLLFGGGLCLSDAIHRSGLDLDLASMLSSLEHVPPWVMVASIALLITFITELTSNMATAALFLPLVAALGNSLQEQGASPGLLMVPAALSASLAFMLPVATPPNALVFAGGSVSIREMCRAGLILNLVGVVLVTIWVSTVGRWLLGI